MHEYSVMWIGEFLRAAKKIQFLLPEKKVKKNWSLPRGGNQVAVKKRNVV